MKKVLIVCNLNAERSVLAEYMVNQWYGDEVQAESCGVIAGSPDGYAASVARDHGLDITSHEARYLMDVPAIEFDEIISFSEDAALEVKRLKLPSHIQTHYFEVRDMIGISGPREERLVIYRGIFEDVKTHILRHFGPESG